MATACSNLVLAAVRSPRSCSTAPGLLTAMAPSGCERADEVSKGDCYDGRRPGDAWAAGDGGDGDARSGHHEDRHDRGSVRLTAALAHGVLLLVVCDGGTRATLVQRSMGCEAPIDTVERRVLAIYLYIVRV